MKAEYIYLAAMAGLYQQQSKIPRDESEVCEIIVECDNEETGICANLHKIGKIKYALPMINAYVLEVPTEKAHTLAGTPGIKAVHQSAFITTQMNHAREIVKADTCCTGRGVTIAFLDTGISLIDDFVKPVNRLAAFRDFVEQREDAYDDNGHGTHKTHLK